MVKTRWPSAGASWTAKLPIPPAPPWTRNDSPSASRAVIHTLDQTVAATSGSDAASTSDTPSGTGMSCPAGTVTWVAYPPAASSAQHSSPTDQPSTPSPSAAMVPLHSMPSTSEAPGGTG